MYEIEKGVPIPPDGRGMQRGGVKCKYPWVDMSIGDSFEAGPYDPDLKNNVAAAASQYAKRNGVKFTLRKHNRGLRVWRIA